MKKCSQCHKEKELQEYNKMSMSKDGHQGICRECNKIISRAFAEASKARKGVEAPSTKVCYDCGLKKPSSQFGKRSVSPDKLNFYCKPCWADRTRKSIRKAKLNGR